MSYIREIDKTNFLNSYPGFYASKWTVSFQIANIKGSVLNPGLFPLFKMPEILFILKYP